MSIQLRPYDIGCEPSPSIPAETLIQDVDKTFLLFWAVSQEVGPAGFLEDLGVAVVNCQQCHATRFGYPNDEGLSEHPLFPFGIHEVESSIQEVVESPWLIEISDQMATSARRIWGAQAEAWIGKREPPLRHFLIPLKEKIFECIATGLAVKRFFPGIEEALAFTTARLFDSSMTVTSQSCPLIS